MANNEASDLIETALNEAIKGFEEHDDGDILVEWVLVAYVTNPEQELGDRYPVLYSNGTIPTYRARGLLTTGLKLLDTPDPE